MVKNFGTHEYNNIKTFSNNFDFGFSRKKSWNLKLDGTQ